MTDLKDIIMKSYLKWIKDNTFLKDLTTGEIKITSPFLDAHNDYITIYVKRIPNGEIRFTDDGFLYSDFSSYGITISGKKKQLFDSTLASYGVKFNQETTEIYIDTVIENVGKVKHRIIQCLVTLNDFFNYTQDNIKELFFYDVLNSLLEREISFTPNIQLRGSSGYEHRIDFSIGMLRNKPEQLIQIVSNPSQTHVAERCLFAFIDIKNTERDFTGIILYKGDASSTFLEAVKSYKHLAYSWDDQKEVVLEMLAH